jgi:transposase
MENIETNAKKLSPNEQYEIRKTIIRLLRKGIAPNEVADTVGVSRSHVYATKKAYEEKGVAAIKPQQRGRKMGEKRLLTPAQEKEIREIIIDKTPEQMKLSFALWTRKAIVDLAKRLYKVDLPLRTVTNYLDRWGFTCQRPTTKAYAQDDVKVKAFMVDEYPEIAKRATVENAEIYWGDETGINNQEYYIRGFSPKGVTPVMLKEAKHEKINMISAITGRGTARFMIYEDAMTQQRFIEFMGRLVHDAQHKVFFIVDNLKVHHGKMVQAWLKNHKDKIEVFYLPSYSPELNPDEYLNHSLKQDVHSGTRPRTKKELHRRTESYMRRLQHNPEKVRNLFRHPKLSYLVLSNV